jgi:predicted permease
VTAAATASQIPLTGSGSDGTFTIVGREWPEDERHYVHKRVVGPRYFEAMGITLLRGREFTEADGAGSPLVTVISEQMARDYWPDSDPLGVFVRVWGGDAEIVGVVAEVKHRGLGIEPRFGTAYVPTFQAGPRFHSWMVVKASVDPLSLVTPAREEVRNLDPNLPLYSVNTMESLVERSVADRRITARIFLAFGLAGLLLATIGVFGVTAYSVQRRTREIGVRMALGGEGGRLVRMVLREEVTALAIGLFIGSLLAVAMARVVSASLFAISSFDLVAYGTTLGVLGGVALLAVYIPARRAARVDPLLALRVE